ncbi:cytochrome c oxidase assembly protein [Rhodoferax sp.]|uniref:cytochrome c oxidase assembly protein n=1 Tax=Rhodoferax sp. TaxID=50421 RepID=UPI0026369EA7|nr:cytochrome c oxidase assembly protein [Rhodoferax sp.]MDD3936598.1 cytochrome c oxidase assembly protein [Rhodoferax sp.]
MKFWSENTSLKFKLVLVALSMFGFGYAIVPLYEVFCDVTGIKVLALGDRFIESAGDYKPLNTQVDDTRTVTVEFDANVRGLWRFKPEKSSLRVHPGEMTTIMYEFQNMQGRSITAQAVPSYAPEQAGPNFHKLECFCFKEHTLAPGEKKSWPVVFVIDSGLPRDVKTITLSYTFFEVGGKTPPVPVASNEANDKTKEGS